MGQAPAGSQLESNVCAFGSGRRLTDGRETSTDTVDPLMNFCKTKRKAQFKACVVTCMQSVLKHSPYQICFQSSAATTAAKANHSTFLPLPRSHLLIKQKLYVYEFNQKRGGKSTQLSFKCLTTGCQWAHCLQRQCIVASHRQIDRQPKKETKKWTYRQTDVQTDPREWELVTVEAPLGGDLQLIAFE